jgi:hypothetical protein
METGKTSADQRVMDRAASAGRPVAGEPARSVLRRRDPARPGHFLDEAPAKSLSEVVARNPSGAVLPAGARETVPPRQQDGRSHFQLAEQALAQRSAAADRRGPYAVLGNSSRGQIEGRQTAGADTFLSLGAFAALESLIAAMVDARLAARTGGADTKTAADRLENTRSEFAANYVRR